MSVEACVLKSVWELVLARSGGDCEVMAGPSCLLSASQFLPRRESAAPVKPSGLLHVCWPCHAHIAAEQNRRRAVRNGWIVAPGVETVDQLVVWRGRPSLLDDGGRRSEQKSLW